jgi:5-methylcytosine-specific restriction endonuclease McrA
MTRVLLLSPYYLPLRIVRWEDAIKMVYEETVEVLVEYNEEVSSPSVTWKMPAVIRLKKLQSLKKRGIKFSRINVYTRDNFTCQYCRKRYPLRALSYDHVVPRASGGKTVWENISTACKSCNAIKADRTCDESGMWPLNKPTRPKHLPHTPPILDVENIPEEWEGYIKMEQS